MYLNYLQNNLIFSLVVGILAVVIYYIDDKRTNQTVNLYNYTKLFIIVGLSVYCSLYIKLNNLLGLNNSNKTLYGGNMPPETYSNINLGEPNF